MSLWICCSVFAFPQLKTSKGEFLKIVPKTLKNYTTPCLHYNVTSLQGVDTKVPVLRLMPYIIWRFPVYSRRAHREQWVLLTQKNIQRRTFRRSYVNVLNAALWSCVFVRVHTRCVCLCESVWRTRQEFLPFKISPSLSDWSPQRETDSRAEQEKLKLAAKKKEIRQKTAKVTNILQSHSSSIICVSHLQPQWHHV